MLATHYKFVTLVIYVVMFLVEVARLYLGYEGNLREKASTNMHVVYKSIISPMYCE